MIDLDNICEKMNELKDKTNAYKHALNIAVAQFLCKERLKMRQLLLRHHYAKDLSYLDGSANKITFSSTNDDKEEEEEEEVTQDPLSYTPPA